MMNGKLAVWRYEGLFTRRKPLHLSRRAAIQAGKPSEQHIRAILVNAWPRVQDTHQRSLAHDAKAPSSLNIARTIGAHNRTSSPVTRIPLYSSPYPKAPASLQPLPEECDILTSLNHAVYNSSGRSAGSVSRASLCPQNPCGDVASSNRTIEPWFGARTSGAGWP